MYSIIVWHNDSVNGTHQHVLFSAKALDKVLRGFELYLTLPEHMRSFNNRNVIQLHHTERGVIASFPSQLRG